MIELYLYDYIEKNKDLTFQEKDMTDIDAMIFSYLAYANYERIMNSKRKMTIAEAAEKHIKAYPEKDNDILAVREANKLLKHLKDITRYKNCMISNYECKTTENSQFCAITIDYKPNAQFVAFEGTNATFSSWKEDLLLSCDFPTESQKLAIHYLNNSKYMLQKSL